MPISSCLKISFRSNHINPNIKFNITLDEHTTSYCFDQLNHEYECEFFDEDLLHVLRLELLGKEQWIDQSPDFLVQVTRVELDYVDITKFFCWKLLPYQTQHGLDTFCEYLGMDGVVTFDFQSPVYKWLKSNYVWYT